MKFIRSFVCLSVCLQYFTTIEEIGMRICSWNINGLRSLRQPLRTVLEQLNCDIICFQETKVTRQALAEDYARIDGYHTFYSWSRLRQGYSGVAIFCKTSLAPIRAEEGIR